ncbi:MAG: hypothetical protein AAGA54_11800 [Myxococcota bacterium]
MPEGSERAIHDRLEALFGDAALPRDVGVLHVLSTWRDEDQARVIRITPQSPKSPTDFFLLNLARARADAIVVTGKILRDEPHLRYDLQGEAAGDLHAWRHAAMERSDPPRVVVLTSGRDLDLDHPTFHGWARPVIATGPEAACRLRGPASDRRIEIATLANPGIREAIRWCQAGGAATVSVEAGPSTARALYADPPAVDELLLSEFLEPDLPHDLRGPSAFDRPPGGLGFRRLSPGVTRSEPSGRWRFTRLSRV